MTAEPCPDMDNSSYNNSSYPNSRGATVAWSKPQDMFDRDYEWGELTRFASNSAPRATLGIVSGRRRQGKTFLVDALTVQANGFMFTAAETTEADSLHQFGEALASYLDDPTPFRFAGWPVRRVGRGHHTADAYRRRRS